MVGGWLVLMGVTCEGSVCEEWEEVRKKSSMALLASASTSF